MPLERVDAWMHLERVASMHAFGKNRMYALEKDDNVLEMTTMFGWNQSHSERSIIFEKDLIIQLN